MNQLFSAPTISGLPVKAPRATPVRRKRDLFPIGRKDRVRVVRGIESKPGARSPQHIDQPNVPRRAVFHDNAALIGRKARTMKIAVGSNDTEILTGSIEPCEFCCCTRRVRAIYQSSVSRRTECCTTVRRVES